MEKALFPRVGGDVIRHDFSVCLGSAHDASCRLLLPRDQDGVEAEGNTVAAAPPGKARKDRPVPCGVKRPTLQSSQSKSTGRSGVFNRPGLSAAPPPLTNTHTH